jgi:hypothetical protein
VGTRGQLSSPSNSTVDGGPGLVLGGFLCNNVKFGNVFRLVHDEQLLQLVLLDPGLAVGVLVVLVGLRGGLGSVQLPTSHVYLLSFVPNY